MIEIKCPRCEQYWYDNDEKVGRDRLCSRCLDHLRHKRRQRGEIDLPFLVVAGVLLFIDLIMITLAALRPRLFGNVLGVYGGLQVFGGLIPLRGFRIEKGTLHYINWRYGRWAVLMALSGMVCIFAFGLIVGFRE